MIDKIYTTGLFTPISLDKGEFSLNGTDYIAVARGDHVNWIVKKVIHVRPEISHGSFARADSNASRVKIRYVSVSFEEVFDNCSDRIKKELIYHFDIFNDNKKNNYLETPVFEIQSNPQIHLSDIKIRRFKMLEYIWRK